MIPPLPRRHLPRSCSVPEHVCDAGRYVQQTAQNLISGLRSASAEVDGLMTSWHGMAATAYGGAWDETHTAALGVFEALADTAELGVVVDRSAATDRCPEVANA
ncbi:WXG100 family type VII secretion target [Nocardia sp. NPDC049190]|uniref:WXG100 family type VII secretion target n=1 Tax=Nocardia sp. NPDC049190 TaxID=3155650 RepID=UPI00340CD184